ncbi:hypothetical protein GMB34_13500 [Turicibacter sanguinis]|uniref:hypothetical protein n=1 Tax=Turicibacter sanguinis TaxID=154288 RepID=UPI0012BC9B25|nr:hypothetical protein [Turicibacter sanguinis]MDB8436742.1 hypothetical protein [Turicibacter sanguinis]MTN80714.1 hypothetical protein [Turicibacter sanguinis]MTN85230.1 hypothetical protein [Turicibacter sanguinis]MTN88051.1 hypothetical protein [Turicibacter sanguinis]MTN90905.1 hypothetical protein [Turicibacter sanguinis]
MPAYMITYDLNSTGQKYDEVIKAIKDSSSAWCSYWKSSYLIKSSLTPDQIVDNVKPHLDNNDRFIVIEVKNNKQGWLTEKQWEYIRENIFN